MGLSFTPVQWIIRGDEAHSAYGSPFKGVGTLHVTADEGSFYAFAGRDFTADDWREIRRFVTGLGVTRIVYERYRDGVSHKEIWRLAEGEWRRA